MYAREINNTIRSFLGCIEEVFTEFTLKDELPTNNDLKKLVNEKLGRNKPAITNENKEKGLKEIYSEFLQLRPLEGDWSQKAKYKYGQMWKQLCSCDPNITLATLTISKMQELVRWYVKNDYCNRTIQNSSK